MMAWLVVLLLSLGVSVHAADIQYLLTTGDVTGIANGTIPPVDGYGVVTIAEPTSAIVWPVPSGCGAGSGRPDWTTITDPLAVTAAGGGMAVRPALVGLFFTSTSPLLPGCHFVPNMAALRLLVREAIAAGTSDLHTIQGFSPYQAWYEMQCRGSESNANCVSTKTNLDAMQPFVPGRGQMVTETGYGATLATDAQAFKVLKGW